MLEDNNQEISFVGFDPFHQSILLNTDGIRITQQPSNGSIGDLSLTNDSNGQLAIWNASYTPNTNFYGTDSITFTITSPNGVSSESTIIINVNPVNDFPTLDTISDIEFNEDQSATFEINAQDVDSDLIISTASSTPNVVASVNENSIIVISAQDYNGYALSLIHI